MKKLSYKQEIFCREYVKNGHIALRAAKKAGYALPEKQAYRVLENVGVLQRIDELHQELIEKGLCKDEIASPDEILLGHTRDIRFNPKSFYDEGGQLIPVHKLPDDVAMSLAGAKTDKLGQLEYKYPDKIRCRESLAKMFGMIPKNGNGKNGDTNVENLQININIEPVDKALDAIK